MGFDVYRLNQDANRSVAQRSTGRVLLEDIVWPDATITNAGGYGQVVYDQGRAWFGGTLRVDHENASAGRVNSLNPFTGERIAEIGRSFYIGAEFGF